jgi:hypothetical protein
VPEPLIGIAEIEEMRLVDGLSSVSWQLFSLELGNSDGALGLFIIIDVGKAPAMVGLVGLVS